MAFSVTPLVGIDLTNVVTAAAITAGQQVANQLLGVQVFGSDGKRYVFAKVGTGGLSASATSVTVNATTFVATATGGSYVAPGYATVIGDYCWLSIASV